MYHSDWISRILNMSRAESNDCWKTWDCGDAYLGDVVLTLKGNLTLAASSENEKALVWTREVDLIHS